MRGGPALLLVVPFKHRKIDHPEELHELGIEQFVALVVLLRGEQAQLAAGLEDGLLGPLAARLEAAPRSPKARAVTICTEYGARRNKTKGASRDSGRTRANASMNARRRSSGPFDK